MFNFLKSDKVSKSKLKIISGYNFRYRNVGKPSEKTIIKYANYFKFDYEIIKSLTDVNSVIVKINNLRKA